jgi:putative ATP-binding cassette transporter
VASVDNLPIAVGVRVPAGDAAAPAAQTEEELASGLIAQVGTLTRALLASRASRAIIALSGSIFVVIAATAYWQIRLNSWNKPFYDALSRRDLPGFLLQLGMFCVIAGTLLVLNVAQRWIVESLKIKLREGLVQDLLQGWMQPRRAFWLANAGSIGVNPDQRMHEDARKLCELSADLGTGLLQASVLLVTFSSVLWVLSQDFSVRIGDQDHPIPGFMLWAAIAYAGVGSLLSYWVGHSLIRRNAERYAREADLRFSLVRINEHLDGISLAAGEADERRRVEIDLADVLAATVRLVAGLTNLTWITAGFGWITTVAPILVAAPLYFTGKISFGGLMMAAAAFTQAQSSLRWFVDNFSVIADWRATLLRVANFRHALTTASVVPEFESQITYETGEPGTLEIIGLQIVSRTGLDVLEETDVVVRAGQRVLIVGAPGTAKAQLFRALAGLWPWGRGRILGPGGEAVLCIPRGTPYLPRGTLREVLAYPQRVDVYDPAEFAQALARLGLERLTPLLDLTLRWDRELNQDEQLSLVFARIVLQAPPWVLIDDIFGSLDDETLARVVAVFTHELQNTGMIHIGRAAQAHDPLFSRVLHLVKAGSERTAPPAEAAP